MGSLWNRSGTIERYGASDLKAGGAKAYFYEAGTTNAMIVYEDAGEASAHTSPVVADAYGRWPDVFVPYVQSYDAKVTTHYDVQLTYTQGIPNPDPIELTVTIPAEEKVATGMVHWEPIQGVRAGYVRLNGRTLGNGASGGTERANADTEALFTYVYNALSDTHAAVSGGRGANAAADYAANKTIVLPNLQGASPIGLDDMGGSAASAFTGLTFNTGDATTPGSSIGDNSLTLTTAQLPAHTHTVKRGAVTGGGFDVFEQYRHQRRRC